MRELEHRTSPIGRVLARLGGLLGTERGVPGVDRTRSLRSDPETPPVDLIDRDDAFVVLVDLPGFGTSDISVSLSDRTLAIRATGNGSSTRDGRYLLQERKASEMARELTLPAAIDDNAVMTDYRSGVMQVVIGKASEKTDTDEHGVTE